AAVFSIPSNKHSVITKDVLAEGVHFLPETPAGLVARKALRTNLSALAAMGASPSWYLLGLLLPRAWWKNGACASWLHDFTDALAEEQTQFGIALLGGDTIVHDGPLAISVTALGEIEKKNALRRSGARPGDVVYVSGTVGDA